MLLYVPRASCWRFANQEGALREDGTSISAALMRLHLKTIRPIPVQMVTSRGSRNHGLKRGKR